MATSPILFMRCHAWLLCVCAPTFLCLHHVSKCCLTLCCHVSYMFVFTWLFTTWQRVREQPPLAPLSPLVLLAAVALTYLS